MPVHRRFFAHVLPFENKFDEVLAQITGSPIAKPVAIGIGSGLVVAGIGAIAGRVSRRRSKASRKRSKSRLSKPLPKHKRFGGRRHKRAKMKVKRGRGLGRKEIHHGHKGGKVVSFVDKRTGKKVRFVAYPKGHRLSKHSRKRRSRK